MAKTRQAADEKQGKAARSVLLTGFEPYGGRGLNPAAEIVKSLHGKTIEGHAVVGRTLPVSYRELGRRLEGLVREVEPALAICLGLWPGEPTIRLERFGLNLAHFEIPDNDGLRVDDEPIAANGATGMRATLPLRRIEAALIAEGIPAKLSSTAGTFLCNVTLYTLMRVIEAAPRPALGGFIHLPYMPEQVALMLADAKNDRRLELHQRADFASMELDRQVRAVSIAIGVSLEEIAAAS
jgi:pyroglutamyl-peptidase